MEPPTYNIFEFPFETMRRLRHWSNALSRLSIRAITLCLACLLMIRSDSNAQPEPVPAAQKTALHLDGTPADPFLAASGKPVVLIFVRTDCPVSNRYAPLIQRVSSQYGAKVALWLAYASTSASAEKIPPYERHH